MFYPKADCCPFNCDEPDKADTHSSSLQEDENLKLCLETPENICAKNEMMRKIQELDFAIIDLNLFLDTHPNCEEALELFTRLCATSKSVKNDYQAKYGPLYANKTPNSTPFMWVEECKKWPWEKNGN